MALAATKTFVAAEVLFAADLNALNTNILNNALALISPLTGNLDVDGFDLLDAGEVEFRDESADPTADGRMRRSGDEVTLRMQDARTDTPARPWAIWADTTGTPAAGIGIGMLFQAESADENPSNFGVLDFAASDVGAGTEDTYFSVLLRVAGRALDEKFRFVSTAGDGFTAILAHAVTSDRTYTLPDVTGGVLVNQTTAAQANVQTGTVAATTSTTRTLYLDDGATVTFAVAFTVAPYVVDGGNNGSGFWLTSRAITTTQFVAQGCGIAATAVTYNWIALGQ